MLAAAPGRMGFAEIRPGRAGCPARRRGGRKRLRGASFPLGGRPRGPIGGGRAWATDSGRAGKAHRQRPAPTAVAAADRLGVGDVLSPRSHHASRLKTCDNCGISCEQRHYDFEQPDDDDRQRHDAYRRRHDDCRH